MYFEDTEVFFFF